MNDNQTFIQDEDGQDVKNEAPCFDGQKEMKCAFCGTESGDIKNYKVDSTVFQPDNMDICKMCIANLEALARVNEKFIEEQDTAPCFDGQDTMDVANEFNRRYVEIKELKAKLEKREEEIEPYEEHLLEMMAEKQFKSVKVGDRNSVRTIYKKKKWIVSKATGVVTSQVVEMLRRLGKGAMVSEGYNAQTLKAFCKEAIQGAAESGNTGEAFMNFETGEYFDEVGDTPSAPPLLPGWKLTKVIDGLPQELRDLLFIKETYELGTRAS